ncbi:hypothetical protein [Desulfonatronum thioautotrophicum]|uniref:hypothetical protein n=1 Tax=Desulfonatronum thioautotrophicum TaxID=617001 RepID=UPI00069C4840|nr:hypothetical protein [Desulfonatronum thioautotrophicum]
MFRQLARELKRENKEPTHLFLYHPLTLATILETVWQNSPRANPADDHTRSEMAELVKEAISHTGVPQELINLINKADGDAKKRHPGSEAPINTQTIEDDYVEKVSWHHLIYAYMVENTRIYEIFTRVLREFLHGEKLASPSPESQRWLRNTENLFYRDWPSFLGFALTSSLRPDIRASRRNAYYRMFGMDLNHGADDNQAYPYEKPKASNRDFVTTFEEFMREVWVGIINAGNTQGSNPTDDAAIANLARRLHDMLTTRRLQGNLLREEFFFVATMSWFHLTVELENVPIIKDLKAEAASPAERLRQVGERVGLPSHGKSENYFFLAELLSPLLKMIEAGVFNNAGQVPPLYLPGTIREDMMQIITHWSLATGRQIKAAKTVGSPQK